MRYKDFNNQYSSKMNLDHLLPKTPKLPKGLIYSYLDGSGNSYYITTDLIQYDPVKAQHSSSGIYTGGNAAQTTLYFEQLEAIKVIIQKVQQNKSDHITNRVKGSGQLRLHNEEKMYILGYNTSSQKELETLLNKMLNT